MSVVSNGLMKQYTQRNTQNGMHLYYKEQSFVIKNTHNPNNLHKNLERLHKLGGALIKNIEYVNQYLILDLIHFSRHLMMGPTAFEKLQAGC